MNADLANKLAGRRVVASVSGGKDSAALSLWLKEQGIDHDRVFFDTGWEHEITYGYLRNELTQALGLITEIHGERAFPDLVRWKGMFPARTKRFCTQFLKIYPMRDHLRTAYLDKGIDVVNAVGIRRAESAARKAAAEWEWQEEWDCEIWRPLIHWTLDDVIAIHKRHGLKPNPLYLRGASRVGCWPCIHASKEEIALVAKTDPGRIDFIRQLEREVNQTNKKGNAAMFTLRPDNVKHVYSPIDEVVVWAKTDRGGASAQDSRQRLGRGMHALGPLRNHGGSMSALLSLALAILLSLVTMGGGQVKSLRAPFPWFGGKSRAAHLVWAAFGDVPNYVEPFAGSLAVLLARPTAPRIETVNDLNAHIANFWRAVAAAPEEVAQWADWPVNEVDLHARHRWLVYGDGAAEFTEAMRHDPDCFNAKRAGWWVWGLCQWIGSGWCSEPEWTGRSNAGRRARGILTADHRQRPALSKRGGMGVLAVDVEHKRPVLAHGGDRGVLLGPKKRVTGKMPKMDRGSLSRMQPDVGAQKPLLRGRDGTAGSGVHATAVAKHSEGILGWMLALQERLRRVRVCCGDWTRVLGRSATECIGTTGIFLDPPYGADAGRDPSLYTHDDLAIAAATREWALEHGNNQKLRIALCGYEGEHTMPENWQCVPWKANGGYAASAGNHENAAKERIWFSPACLPVHERQRDLFASGGAA